MSIELSNALAYAWIGLGLVGFGFMVVGFGRLFREAWRSSDRWASVKKVLNVVPRKNGEWPNMTREADLIAIGALIGVVFFTGFLALVFM